MTPVMAADEPFLSELEGEFETYRSRIAQLAIATTERFAALAIDETRVIDLAAIEAEQMEREIEIDFNNVADLENFILAAV